jgi:hypothetical protein
MSFQNLKEYLEGIGYHDLSEPNLNGFNTLLFRNTTDHEIRLELRTKGSKAALLKDDLPDLPDNFNSSVNQEGNIFQTCLTPLPSLDCESNSNQSGCLNIQGEIFEAKINGIEYSNLSMSQLISILESNGMLVALCGNLGCTGALPTASYSIIYLTEIGPNAAQELLFQLTLEINGELVDPDTGLIQFAPDRSEWGVPPELVPNNWSLLPVMPPMRMTSNSITDLQLNFISPDPTKVKIILWDNPTALENMVCLSANTVLVCNTFPISFIQNLSWNGVSSNASQCISELTLIDVSNPSNPIIIGHAANNGTVDVSILDLMDDLVSTINTNDNYQIFAKYSNTEDENEARLTIKNYSVNELKLKYLASVGNEGDIQLGIYHPTGAMPEAVFVDLEVQEPYNRKSSYTFCLAGIGTNDCNMGPSEWISPQDDYTYRMGAFININGVEYRSADESLPYIQALPQLLTQHNLWDTLNFMVGSGSYTDMIFKNVSDHCLHVYTGTLNKDTFGFEFMLGVQPPDTNCDLATSQWHWTGFMNAGSSLRLSVDGTVYLPSFFNTEDLFDFINDEETLNQIFATSIVPVEATIPYTRYTLFNKDTVNNHRVKLIWDHQFSASQSGLASRTEENGFGNPSSYIEAGADGKAEEFCCFAPRLVNCTPSNLNNVVSNTFLPSDTSLSIGFRVNIDGNAGEWYSTSVNAASKTGNQVFDIMMEQIASFFNPTPLRIVGDEGGIGNIHKLASGQYQGGSGIIGGKDILIEFRRVPNIPEYADLYEKLWFSQSMFLKICGDENFTSMNQG